MVLSKRFAALTAIPAASAFVITPVVQHPATIKAGASPPPEGQPVAPASGPFEWKTWKINGNRWPNVTVPIQVVDPDPNSGEKNDVLDRFTDVLRFVEQKTAFRFYPASGDPLQAKVTVHLKADKCDTSDIGAPPGGDSKDFTQDVQLSLTCSDDDMYAIVGKIMGFEKPNKGKPTSEAFTAINYAYNASDALLNPPDQRAPDQCLNTVPNSDPDHSLYHFTIDESTALYAVEMNATRLGVKQHCEGGDVFGISKDTENFGFTFFDFADWKLQPTRQYAVTVPRCERRRHRNVDLYTGALCSKANWDSCVTCTKRPICTRNTDVEVVKAVSAFDSLKWVCHSYFRAAEKAGK